MWLSSIKAHHKGEVEPMGSITEKQRLFCQEYITDLNGKRAAIRAGYSEKSAQEQASRLLSYAKVQRELEKLMQERSKRMQIDADDVIQGIKSIVDNAIQINDDGNMLNPTAALKGYELLGKHLAMWTDKKIVDSTTKVTGFQFIGV